jgi:Uri superfamily endonuclease
MREPIAFRRSAAAQALPQAAGTYALLLRLQRATPLALGRFGTMSLYPGLYVYVGSALGPGGIRGRVARHLRETKQMHWHIDILTQVCPVESVAWVTGTERFECTWAQALLDLPAARAPISGFGSSDCSGGCPAHLVQLGLNCGLGDVVGATWKVISSGSPSTCSPRFLED